MGHFSSPASATSSFASSPSARSERFGGSGVGGGVGGGVAYDLWLLRLLEGFYRPVQFGGSWQRLLSEALAAWIDPGPKTLATRVPTTTMMMMMTEGSDGWFGPGRDLEQQQQQQLQYWQQQQHQQHQQQQLWQQQQQQQHYWQGPEVQHGAEVGEDYYYDGGAAEDGVGEDAALRAVADALAGCLPKLLAAHALDGYDRARPDGWLKGWRAPALEMRRASRCRHEVIVVSGD